MVAVPAFCPPIVLERGDTGCFGAPVDGSNETRVFTGDGDSAPLVWRAAAAASGTLLTGRDVFGLAFNVIDAPLTLRTGCTPAPTPPAFTGDPVDGVGAGVGEKTGFCF